MMKIYADNAATTKMSGVALEAMLPYMTEHYGNPSSLYTIGQEAKEGLEAARATVASCIGAQPREITFTSGGSEADNQAILSAARLGERKGKKHIISTTFEHHAVLHTLKRLEKQGFEVTLLDVHADGLVTAQQVADAIREAHDAGIRTVMITGDHIDTAVAIAKQLGIVTDRSQAITGADLDRMSDEELDAHIEDYGVYARVQPEHKTRIVEAWKSRDQIVAMTGDGVNDVLALKEADCSIAMASGSDVACQVSHIVLLDSNFASMPSVVAEGRRVINNIERSASLYLVKNIFSFCLAFFTLFATLPYPFSPAQLTLVSAVTIGIPSFILAMEPNESLVKGKFLRNVLFRALPAAMTDLAMVVGILLFYIAFQLDDTAMITICTGVMGIVGLMMVHRTCQPYNTIRKVMIVVLSVLFVIAYFGFPALFNLQKLNLQSALILIVFGLLSWPVMKAFCRLNDHMRIRFEAWRAGKTAKAA